MRLTVHHSTHYQYDNAKSRFIQSLMLYPSICESQKVVEWSVTAEHAQFGANFTNGAGDEISTMTLIEPCDEVEIVVSGIIETTDTSGILRDHREMIQPEAYLRPTSLTKLATNVCDFAQQAAEGQEADSLALAHQLSAKVREAIVYTPGSTHHNITAAEALSAGKGVCQDQTHLLIAAAQYHLMPARYVVGYLHSDSEGNSHQASHAWCEIHIKELGWVGFDATNGCCPDERYIRLGSGLNAHNAAPIRGIYYGEGEEHLDVSVRVGEAQQ